MKTYQIKDLLKKDILIIELAEGGEYSKDLHAIVAYGIMHNIPEGYVLLGKPDEIKEEDARKLVQYLTRRDLTITPKNYSKGKDGRFEDITFTESLLSAIESVIYWDVNPVKLFDMDNLLKAKHIAYDEIKKFNEAELRTFDRNRTLIFVKN